MLNLGNITFGLSANTSGLQAAQQNLQNFGNRVSQNMAMAKRGIDTNVTALMKQEGAAVRALQNIQNMSAKISATKIAPDVQLGLIKQAEEAVSSFIRTMNTRSDRPLDALAFQRANLGLKEAIDAVNRSLRQEAQAASAAGTAGATALERQTVAAIRAKAQVDLLNDAIARSNVSPKTQTRLSGSANQALSGFTAAMSGPKALDQAGFVAAQLALKNSLTMVQRELRATATASNFASAGFKGLTEAAALTVGPLNGIVFRLRAANDIMREHGMVIGGTVAAMSGLALTLGVVGSQLIKTVIDYQKAEMALRGITNSSAIAGAELGFLRDVSMQAGLGFSDLAPTFSRFVAAASGAGQSISVTNDEFKKFAMLAGTLHLTTDEVSRALLAFDQMWSAGKVQGQEMRQLFNVLPSVYHVAGEAAKQMGVDLKTAMKSGSLESGKFIQLLLDNYMKMFNIDMGKPINSLQASLTRVGTAWQGFLLNVDQAIGASAQFQMIVDQVVAGLTNLGGNVDKVITVIGTLSGALIGLFTVLAARAAITGMVSLLGALVPLVTSLYSAIRLVTTASEIWTAVQLGLNVAMAANPIGAVVTAIATLVAIIGGATIGYRLFNDVVNKNQSTLADTSSINTYIKAQQDLGKNIASTTKQMVKQIEVMSKANDAEIDKASRDYMNAKKRMDTLIAIRGKGSVDKVPGGQRNWNQAQSDLAITQSALTNATIAGGKLLATLLDLKKLGSLPEDDKLANGVDPKPPKGVDPKPPKGPKTSDPDRGLRQLTDIIQKARDADQALALMWRGPMSSGLLESLEEAKRRLYDLDGDQIKKLTATLSGAGVNVAAFGGLESAMAVVIERTRQATDTVKEFGKVWNDIQQGQDQLKGIREQLDYLTKGGDPEKMWIVEAIAKARDELRKLSTAELPELQRTLESLTNNDGSQAFNANAIKSIMDAASGSRTAGLDAVKKALEAIGYSGATAQDAMEAFYKALGQGDDTLSKTTSFFSDLTKQLRSFADTRDQLSAIRGGGSLENVLDLGYLAEAREALRGLTDDGLARVVQELGALGMAGDTAAQKMANFLKTQDRNREAIDNWRSLLETQKQDWISWSDNSVDSLYKVLTGAQSFGDGLKDVLADLGKTILNAALFDPLKNSLAKGITGMIEGRTSGSSNPADAGAEKAGSSLGILGSIASTVANVLGVDLLGSVIKSAVGTSAVTGAQAAHAATMAAATTGLIAFTGAVYAAAAAAAGSAAASTVATVATVLVANGGHVRRFASGGLNGPIVGPGGPRDDKIPAMISNGEFIVNAASTRRNLRLLHMINSGMFPKFAAGGEAGGTDFVPGMTKSVNQESLLRSNQKSAIIDARSTFHVTGDLSDAKFEQLKAYAEERDSRLREELPYLIDNRVTDSTWRRRY